MLVDGLPGGCGQSAELFRLLRIQTITADERLAELRTVDFREAPRYANTLLQRLRTDPSSSITSRDALELADRLQQNIMREHHLGKLCTTARGYFGVLESLTDRYELITAPSRRW